MKRSRNANVWFILLSFAWISFFVIPLLPMIMMSLSPSWRWPQVWPTSWDFRAWEYLWLESSQTWSALGTSLGIAVAVTLINLCLALPAADAITRRNIVGKQVFTLILYAPIFIPGFVAMMGIHRSFIDYGLADTMTGVILATLPVTFPYMLRSLTIVYETLGDRWEEQGRMLGAGRWNRLRFIVWPALAPGIAIGCGLSMVVAFSQYLIPLVLGGGRVQTLTQLMLPYLAGQDPAMGAAYAIFFSLIAFMLLWLSGAAVRSVNRFQSETRREEG
jgi:putative spermidine/putrescine transport system permease protein